MSFTYYQASGKYKYYAPSIIFSLSFVLASIIGIVCGFLFRENILYPEIDIVTCLLLLFLLIFLCSKVTKKIIERLHFRNPEVAFRLGLISSSLGWVFSIWLTRYILLSNENTGFFDFLIIRLKNGFLAGLTLGEYNFGYTFIFNARWFIAIPIYLIELSIMPYFYACVLKVQAGLPFSEVSMTWYKQLLLPYTILTPPKKDIIEMLNYNEEKIFKQIQPDNKNKNKYNYGVHIYIYIYLKIKKKNII
jgi:hypothetical protein